MAWILKILICVQTVHTAALTWKNSPFIQQPLKFLLGQLHQPIHLIFSALEVLNAEGIHRHFLDIQLFTPT